MARCPSCLAHARDADKYCSYCQKPLPRIEVAEELAPVPEPVAAPAVIDAPSLERGDDALIAAGTRQWGSAPKILQQGLSRLTSVAAWRVEKPQPHWVLMTMGLTSLDVRPFAYEYSGAGYELIARVAEAEIPERALPMLDRLAAEAESTPPKKQKKMTLKGVAQCTIAEEPELAPFDTANGRVEFRQVLARQSEFFDNDSLKPRPTGIERLATKESRPAIGIRFDASSALRSHRGGSATVPENFEWPERKGVPLPLLLELDLSEVPPTDLLPARGRLLVFGLHDDGDERVKPLSEGLKRWSDVFEVRFVEGAGKPMTRGVQLPHQALTFTPFTDAPNFRWPTIHAALEKLDEEDDGTGKPFEEYSDAFRSKFPHQLLGHSHSVQDEALVEALREVDMEASYADLVERATQSWVPLLQLESDAPWNFAGHGRLFLVGPREAIAQRRFSEVRAVIQR